MKNKYFYVYLKLKQNGWSDIHGTSGRNTILFVVNVTVTIQSSRHTEFFLISETFLSLSKFSVCDKT